MGEEGEKQEINRDCCVCVCESVLMKRGRKLRGRTEACALPIQSCKTAELLQSHVVLYVFIIRNTILYQCILT